MNINRKFKDSVFTSLFSSPDLLRELYCALNGVTLPQDIPVTINTLENVLFLDIYNDISFEIGGKLIILIEHQSSINPNMAFRLLLYISRVLEKRIKISSAYSKIPISIPWPEFYVLYNGKDDFPEEQIYRLSDLFDKPETYDKTNPLLELEVKVLNINEGRNKSIVNRCRKLAEYSEFMARIHSYWKELGDLEEGIRKAIKYCHRHDILNGYLEIHGSEVLNMLLAEWNMEDAIDYAREEGREEGRLDGKADERIAIARNLLAEGSTPEFVQKIIGLSVEEIEKL